MVSSAYNRLKPGKVPEFYGISPEGEILIGEIEYE
jgi:hypothetical protein